ncbi:WYL domain-containing protein, partial [Gelidibacter salicanalis]|uniref:WYL domain-containing protein n=1 Tax=Gelidibacter salicanalis TaxID=291193 RepID=UPI0034D4EC49
MVIELRLIINQEFKTRLFSFGPDLQVLAPKSLRDSMHEKLKRPSPATNNCLIFKPFSYFQFLTITRYCSSSLLTSL